MKLCNADGQYTLEGTRISERISALLEKLFIEEAFIPGDEANIRELVAVARGAVEDTYISFAYPAAGTVKPVGCRGFYSARDRWSATIVRCTDQKGCGRPGCAVLQPNTPMSLKRTWALGQSVASARGLSLHVTYNDGGRIGVFGDDDRAALALAFAPEAFSRAYEAGWASCAVAPAPGDEAERNVARDAYFTYTRAIVGIVKQSERAAVEVFSTARVGDYQVTVTAREPGPCRPPNREEYEALALTFAPALTKLSTLQPETHVDRELRDAKVGDVACGSKVTAIFDEVRCHRVVTLADGREFARTEPLAPPRPAEAVMPPASLEQQMAVITADIERMVAPLRAERERLQAIEPDRAQELCRNYEVRRHGVRQWERHSPVDHKMMYHAMHRSLADVESRQREAAQDEDEARIANLVTIAAECEAVPCGECNKFGPRFRAWIQEWITARPKLSSAVTKVRRCDGYYDDGVMPTRCTAQEGCGRDGCSSIQAPGAAAEEVSKK